VDSSKRLVRLYRIYYETNELKIKLHVTR